MIDSLRGTLADLEKRRVVAHADVVLRSPRAEDVVRAMIDSLRGTLADLE